MIVAPPAVVHAVATEPQASPDGNLDSEVVPTAGVLDGIFGSQPKRAKKESEDGRKATALPPPDPSTVDWSGVPTHQPRRGETETEEAASPLTDMRRTPSTATGSGVSKPAATIARPTAPRPTPSQTTKPQGDPSLPPSMTPPTSSSQSTNKPQPIGNVPSSTANLRRPSDVPATIPGRAASATTRSTNDIPPIPVSPNNRIPNVVTTPVTPAPTTSQSEISDSRSTRRSGRKSVDALTTENVLAQPETVTELPSESASLTELTPAPSVSRRELMPLESTLPKLGTSEASKGTSQSLVEMWNSPAAPPKTAGPSKNAPSSEKDNEELQPLVAPEKDSVAAVPMVPPAKSDTPTTPALPGSAIPNTVVSNEPVGSGASSGVPSLPLRP